MGAAMAYINPPTSSKINYTQLVAGCLTILAAAKPELIPLIDAANNPDIQTAVVAAIAGVGQLSTVVFRTWFTLK